MFKSFKILGKISSAFLLTIHEWNTITKYPANVIVSLLSIKTEGRTMSAGNGTVIQLVSHRRMIGR